MELVHHEDGRPVVAGDLLPGAKYSYFIPPGESVGYRIGRHKPVVPQGTRLIKIRPAQPTGKTYSPNGKRERARRMGATK